MKRQVASPEPKNEHSALLVWVVGSISLTLAAVLLVVHSATLLRIELPIGATLVGITLYLRRPVAYVHFVLWSWLLTPFIRRLIDWQLGFQDQNLILTTPLLISAVTGLSVLKCRDTLRRTHLMPFVISSAGILYGFCVGMLLFALHADGAPELSETIYGLFNWLTPILFGLHLYLHRTKFPENKRAIERSFLWGVLLLGSYGIYQYVYAPLWDVIWLRGIGITGAFGLPEPLQIRVWSTLGSPAAFANILTFGLVILLFVKSRFTFLANIVGYGAFFLSLVRTAWFGWLICLLFLCKGVSGRRLVRLVVSLLLIPLFLTPLLLIPEASKTVQQRFQTFSQLREDGSASDREYMYHILIPKALDTPFGLGLRNQLALETGGVDSGILQGWFMLGPLGFTLYFSGILLALRGVSLKKDNQEDSALFRAVAIGLLVESINSQITTGIGGMLVWMSLGFFACCKYDAMDSVDLRQASAGTKPAKAIKSSSLLSEGNSI